MREVMSARSSKQSSSPAHDDPPSQGSSSPLVSSQLTTNRVSLIQLSAEQKAIRIKLYRNGDKLFRGTTYTLRSSIRTIDALMEDLTRLFSNQSSLPKGAQCIFKIDGSSKIISLDEFEAGHSYVVSSSDVFIKLNYQSLNKPDFYTCGRNKNMKQLEPNVKNGRILVMSPNPRTARAKQSMIPKACRANGTDSTIAKGAATKNGHSLDANQNKSLDGSSQMSSSSLSILFPKKIISLYDIGGIVGDGNFATVHECVHRSTKQRFALKIIDKKACKGKEGMIENEVSILKRIKHSNIIQLIEDYDFPNEYFLVMELMTGGDLFDAIAQATKFSEEQASGFMHNLTSALIYLHSLNICHRDIKPENLLICDAHKPDRRILKLGDFGLAVLLSPGHKLYTVCGTPNYVAPEILAEKGYDHAVDIWAAGVIAYVLLCGFPPFLSPENNQDELFDQILQGKYEFAEPYWDDVSECARELITQMLQVDLTKRLSAQQVMNHPWITQRTRKESNSKSSSNNSNHIKPSIVTKQTGLRRSISNEASA